jgi:hypothetical protein
MKKTKNFNCMTNHNGKTPQPESMASDFYFIKEASLARRKIENSPSKRKSGKKVNSFEIWTTTGKKTSSELTKGQLIRN